MIGRIVRSLLAVVVLGLAPFAPPTAEAATLPPASQVSVKSLTYSGAGCKAGSVGTSLSADRASVTLIFDQLVVSSGPGIPTSEALKKCLLSLTLAAPAGWSYTVGTIDYRGYAQLPAGASAQHVTTANFQGQSAQGSAGVTLTGPISKDYLLRSTVAPTGQFSLPCGTTTALNINEQVLLKAPVGKPAQVTTDSIDGKVKMVLGLQWKQC